MGGTPHWRRGHLAWLQAAARTSAAERERCAAIVERWNAAPTHDWSPAIGTALKAGLSLARCLLRQNQRHADLESLRRQNFSDVALGAVRQGLVRVLF
jgi:hypothetical protein